MPSLTEEIAEAAASQAAAAKEAKEHRQKQSMDSLAEGFEYVFGEPPDSVGPLGQWGAVAEKDGLRFVISHDNESRPHAGLHVLCTCKHCGHEFVSWETLGPTKNHYSTIRERGSDERRERAISALAKLKRRDFQPNGHDHDHVCYAGAVDSVRSRVRSAAKATGLSQSEIVQRVLLSL